MDKDLEHRRAAARFIEIAASAQGMNRRALADAAGVDPGTISDFFAGTRWPLATTRASLELAVGVPLGTIAEIRESGSYDGIPITTLRGDAAAAAQPEAPPAPVVGSHSGISDDVKLVDAPDAMILRELERRLRTRPDFVPEVEKIDLQAVEAVGASQYDLDLAAHTDPPGYVRDADREVPSDEGA